MVAKQTTKRDTNSYQNSGNEEPHKKSYYDSWVSQPILEYHSTCSFKIFYNPVNQEEPLY